MSDYEALRLAANSAVPWNSVDAYTHKERMAWDHISDDAEMIRKCFNCKKEECDNCHSRKHSNEAGKRAVRMKEVEKIFLLYYCTGFNKKQICEVMQISRTTYLRYEQRFVMKKKTR